MRQNPDKYVIKGLLSALAVQNVTAYLKKFPIETPVPGTYVLITAVSKAPTERSKEDWEWSVKVTFNIVRVNVRGFAGNTSAEDVEQICMNVCEYGFAVDGFSLKRAEMIESMPLDMDDKTTTIERRVLIYEFWMQQFDPGYMQPPVFVPMPLDPPIRIPAGTPIPYILSADNYPGYGKASQVLTLIKWIDPNTNANTGRFVRVYDIPVVLQDANGDGTGDFTGWAIYGHPDNGNFKEDTYIVLQ